MSPEAVHETRRRRAIDALSNDLRIVRHAAGMTQEQVALAADISVHTYSSLERGQSPSGAEANPTIDTVLRILEALRIEIPRISHTR